MSVKLSRRRDTSSFARNTYNKIITMILNKCTFDEAVDGLVTEVRSLLNRKVPIEDLIITKTLGSSYKSDTFYIKAFADRLEKDGIIISPGDHISFVFVKSSSKLLVDKMRLAETNVEPIDYDYYIEKELMHPINRLFKIAFETDMSGSKRMRYNSNDNNWIIACV